MLTFEQIKELIDLVARHRLSGVELERSGFRLRIDGHAAAPAASAAPLPAASPPPAAPAPSPPPVVEPAVAGPAPSAAATAEAEGAHVLTSPIVGTFYRSPSPEAPVFVEVGDKVRKGQVLCIVEAMKLMNEIESDADGTIEKVFAQNAQPVEYGEPLFAIRPA